MNFTRCKRKVTHHSKETSKRKCHIHPQYILFYQKTPVNGCPNVFWSFIDEVEHITTSTLRCHSLPTATARSNNHCINSCPINKLKILYGFFHVYALLNTMKKSHCKLQHILYARNTLFHQIKKTN